MMSSKDDMYTKGFNHGYVLAEYRSELLQSIVDSHGKATYLQGVEDGKQEYERERTRAREAELEKLKKKKVRDWNRKR